MGKLNDDEYDKKTLKLFEELIEIKIDIARDPRIENYIALDKMREEILEFFKQNR